MDIVEYNLQVVMEWDFRRKEMKSNVKATESR